MQPLDRAEVEEFLYGEADLLDSWRLKEWCALLADSARYIIPPTGVCGEEAFDIDPDRVLCLVADDRRMLEARVRRLSSQRAHAENPRSRLRHLVTNIRFTMESDRCVVWSNVVIYRARRLRIDQLVGRCRHVLVAERLGCIQLAEKIVVLENEILEPLSTLGIIL